MNNKILDDNLFKIYCDYYFNTDIAYKNLLMSDIRIKKSEMQTPQFLIFKLNYEFYELRKVIYLSIPKCIRKFIRKPYFIGYDY